SACARRIASERRWNCELGLVPPPLWAGLSHLTGNDGATSVRSPPHATRACPGCALSCASRAGPTCGGEGLGAGVVRETPALRIAPPPSPALPHPNSGLP